MTMPTTLTGGASGRRRTAGILMTDGDHAHRGSVPDPGSDTRGGTPGNVVMRGGGLVLVPDPVGGMVVGVVVRGEGVKVIMIGVGVAMREVGVAAGGTKRSQHSLSSLKSTVARSPAS